MTASQFGRELVAESEWLYRVFSNTSLGARLLDRLSLDNLRHVFYLITPYETAVQDLEDVPNYNVEVSAWWFVLITIEFLVLILSGNHDRLALNDTITSISAGMMSQCFKFGGRTVAIFLYVFIWNNWRIVELPWDSPWTWILCLIVQDFLYYLGHRAVHEIGIFWGLHTIHHSSEYYNLSTALRQAAIQDAGLAIYDVFQAFFIPPPIFLIHRYFSEIFQFWMHTSLLGALGPLGFLFNTPSHHRVHHGRNPYCIDKNYGGVLIVWDRMFGTFEAERPDDPPIYGLVKQEATFDQMYLQFHSFLDYGWSKARMKDEKGKPIFESSIDKIRSVFYPPGWFPGVQVRPFFHWYSMVNPAQGVPEIEEKVVKYNPRIVWWKKTYVVAHFLLLLSVFFHFEYDRDEYSQLAVMMKIAYFVWCVQSFSYFFDRKWWAPWSEIARCSTVIVYYFYLIRDSYGIGPNRIFMFSFHGSSILFWLGYLAVKRVIRLRIRRRVAVVAPEIERKKKKKKKEQVEIKLSGGEGGETREKRRIEHEEKSRATA